MLRYFVLIGSHAEAGALAPAHLWKLMNQFRGVPQLWDLPERQGPEAMGEETVREGEHYRSRQPAQFFVD